MRNKTMAQYIKVVSPKNEIFRKALSMFQVLCTLISLGFPSKIADLISEIWQEVSMYFLSEFFIFYFIYVFLFHVWKGG